MGCQVYDDGSYWCDYPGQYWEYCDAYGNCSYGEYSQDGSGIDPNTLAQTIGDTLSSIFGGGQQGYYAPNRNQQYPYSYPGPGPYYPNQQGVGINAGLNRQGIGAGFNISPTMMLIGAVVIGAFVFGKRGR